MSSDFSPCQQQAAAALRQGRFTEALALIEPVVGAPDAPVAALQIAGAALTRLGRLDEAEAPLRRALTLQPGDAISWINLGQLFARREDWTQVEESFARAIALSPEQPELHCLHAKALIDAGRYGKARRVLQTVLARHPDLGRAWVLMGVVHQKLEQPKQAWACYEKALPLASDPETLTMLATIHANNAARIMGSDPAQALLHIRRATGLQSLLSAPIPAVHTALHHAVQRAIELHPDATDLQLALAGELVGNRLLCESVIALAHSYLLRHGQGPLALPMRLLVVQAAAIFCDWGQSEQQRMTLLRHTLQAQAESTTPEGAYLPPMYPFGLLYLPFGPDELQSLTQTCTAIKFPALQAAAAHAGRLPYVGAHSPGTTIRTPKLRIGYLSADFHDHATMSLAAGMFEAHDRARFEIIGVCLNRNGMPADGDAMRARALQAFDRFEVAEELDDGPLIERIRTLGLDIAIDLKGHTNHGRMGIFIERVAPVQIHYLGYPGTLGMPGAIDYLVADRVVIPEASRQFYSEKIMELPDSYQVNDRQRAVDKIIPGRTELGLPQDAFVFCCFNDNYKITREVFGLWMQLLQDKADSVLWLLSDNETATHNIRQAAQEAGINPQRLIFAPRARLPQHLARHAQADLFLDTFPYNAHTTASDALWVGLPVLTRTGETFASRVAASLLTACNLPELITRTPQEYLEKAKDMANNPDQLKSIRQKLIDTRQTVPLFDTERFTRHIEKAYDLAWERFARGLPPDHIVVPPTGG